ncbi:MAG: ChaN family lipoprotein, partial [Planctomycetota bacterium]
MLQRLPLAIVPFGLGVCVAAALTSCAASPATPAPTASPASLANATTVRSADDAEPPWAAPPIEHAVVVLDGHTGRRVAFDAMLDALAGADVAFLGETHVDETTHRVELAVYEGLIERRDGDVVLAMEMFERDVQPVLDDYIAGAIDEETFLARSRPWGQYRSAYRPLIERARVEQRPVVASNFPRPLVRRVAMQGLDVLDELEGDERAHAPLEILPNTPAYWKRVDNAIRGHLGMMGGSGDDQRLTSTQTLWDNAMGESCALALDAHPGAMVLHVNGAFHSSYWDGTVHQLRLRKPDARVLTVDIRASRSPVSARLGGAPEADYVVVAERRATDLNEGRWTVALSRALEYRFHLPEGATDEQPAPLLLWLGDDGLTGQDGMDLWKDRLGDEAAIAAIEPAYRALMDDRSEGGRWTWPDSYLEDVGALVGATEEIWAYLVRSFPVDPTRVVVAGEGTGATAAAAIALLGDRMDHAALAFGPSRYARLKDFPLPLPELRGDEPPRDVTLEVVGTAEDESWWSDELAAYDGVGLPGAFSAAPDDAAGRDLEQERAVRAALGLGPPPAGSAAPPASLAVSTDSPRARHWARLHALRHRAATGQSVAVVMPGETPPPGAAPLDVPIHPQTAADAIPSCPGPFGGTTVLVLPPGVTEADR